MQHSQGVVDDLGAEIPAPYPMDRSHLAGMMDAVQISIKAIVDQGGVAASQ